MSKVREFRPYNFYEIRCVCGQYIEARTKKLECPKCGRELEVQWQGNGGKDGNISGREV